MRTILDRELRRWEVFATTGEYGSPNPAKLAFRCVSDAGLRPRILVFAGDKSDAEQTVAEASAEELLRLLESAQSLS